MSRRLFSHNAALGITTYAHVDEDSDRIVLEKVADETALLEALQRKRNGFTSFDRMGDGLQQVAEVPMHEYAKWLADGRDKDQAFIRRWVNDPENRRYRVRDMRI
jgi:hypothetical protein